MNDNKHPTRERILDAAEELFAQRGFEGVSVRQIMTQADADVSLAYYHFKSKQDLFDQVMLRRVEFVNEVHLQALEEVESRHPDDEPSVEEIIGAFTTPLLHHLVQPQRALAVSSASAALALHLSLPLARPAKASLWQLQLRVPNCAMLTTWRARTQSITLLQHSA